MRKNVFVLAFLVLLAFPTFGVQEYYDLSKSIRSLGMGGAFYGLSDDEYALFSNPAGLSLRRTGSELMARLNAHTSSEFVDSGFKLPSTLGNYLEERQKLEANAGIFPYFVSKNLAIGLLLADTKGTFSASDVFLDKIQELYPSALSGTLTEQQIDAAVNSIKAQPGGTSAPLADLTLISDSGLVIGYAQSAFSPNLHLGINLKGLFRMGGRKVFTAGEYTPGQGVKFDPNDVGGRGFGVDFDLGATYELPQLPVGAFSRASLVLNNLLATQYEISKANAGAPGLARTLNFGWLTAFEGVAFVDNFNVMVDITDISLGGQNDPHLGARTGNFMKKLHLGVEMPIGRFSVRAGLNQGYLTAGVGLNLYALRLDLATYGEETGDVTKSQSRRYALTLALGLGSAPPAPVARPVKDSSPIITPATPEPSPKKEVAPEAPKTEQPNPESAPKKETL